MEINRVPTWEALARGWFEPVPGPRAGRVNIRFTVPTFPWADYRRMPAPERKLPTQAEIPLEWR